jgi:hypothetical protein
MSYTVVFTPEAEAQLVELYGYIAEKAVCRYCCVRTGQYAHSNNGTQPRRLQHVSPMGSSRAVRA